MDVAAPPAALIDIWEGASAGALNFSIESDGKIAFDAPQGFRIRVNIIEIGGGSIDRVHVAEPLFGGSVASVSDLLLLRPVSTNLWDPCQRPVVTRLMRLTRLCCLQYLTTRSQGDAGQGADVEHQPREMTKQMG